MDGLTIFSASLALVLLFGGHIIRTIRQAYLFHRYFSLHQRFDLLVALCFGYLFDTVLPFKIGEFIRIFYVTVRCEIPASLVAATVAAERSSDLVVAALLLPLLEMLISKHVSTPILITSLIFFLLFCGAVLFTVLIHHSKKFRVLLWHCAGLFNNRIALEIVNFSWTFSDLMRTDLLTIRYALSTVLMWVVYLGAYSLFACVTGFSFSDVIAMLFASPLHPIIATGHISFIVFTALPIVLVICYGLIRGRVKFIQNIRFGMPPVDAVSSSAVFRSFLSIDDYNNFLKAHFSAAPSLVTEFALCGLENTVIQRVLPGGSDALTALVETNDQFCIRKFAMGAAGTKLSNQAAWLQTHAKELPLCEVIAEKTVATGYAYDMPYILSARDFYEVIHTSKTEESCRIFTDVINNIHNFHVQHRQVITDAGLKDAYLDQKVLSNLTVIMEFVRSILDETYSINGVEFSISEWNIFMDRRWLHEQIQHPSTTIVHGDLTIENIIVAPDSATGWYIIDPNPENILNTEFIDWAKMMQSLHLGYEGLNKAGPCVVQNSNIRVAFHRSDNYRKLFETLSDYLRETFGEDGLREILFHEIVNYLRLLPYKIRHAPDKAITFFACASFLLREYTDAFQKSGQSHPL